jgi:opacity protein-like surface antigen
MKHIIFILSFTVVILAFTATSYAQSSRLYMAGYMGLNTYGDNEFSETTTPVSGDIKFKNAFSMAGSLGLRLTRQFRVEGELSYRKSDMDVMDVPAGSFKMDGQIRSWISLLNGYYDFNMGWTSLNPFLSAGLGVAWHNTEIDDAAGIAPDASDDDLGLAWQVGGGLKLRMSDDMAFTGGYRYLATSDIGFDNYELDYDSHELRVGVEYDIPVSRRR